MAKIFLVVIVLLCVALLFMSVGIMFRADGKFHSEDVGQSKAMRDRGIQCARTQDCVAQNRQNTIKEMCDEKQ